jgi:UDP-N-acetylmuramoyl-L-alanyl-D-glutamate--2,6-diaminopimelate ligase
VEYHSKMIKPGSIFVAVTGYKDNGNRYIDDAVANGAVAVATEAKAERTIPQLIVPNARAALADLAALFYSPEGQTLKVCGVTGTNGKTTTCFLIKRMMEARGKKVGLITSLLYDDGRNRIKAERTTPESLDIHRLLHAMTHNSCANAIIEVSSHALALERVRNIEFQIAVYTNLTRDHLDFHADMDEYLEAKALLLEKVVGEDKWAIINIDSEPFRSLLPRVKCSHLTYALEDSSADLYLESYELRPDGATFMLHTPTGTRKVIWRLVGKFNLYNALAAAGGAFASGIDLDAIVAGLEAAETIPGRLQRVQSDAPFSVYIDFAHTPEALNDTLDTLRELNGGRILTLFGCGGDRDRGKRPLMAGAVCRKSDYVVLTSDNPRSEELAQIFDDAREGFLPGVTVEVIEDRGEAIRTIIDHAEPGDKVLLAGKGAEEYQEIKGERHPFSDKAEATAALKQQGYTVAE